MHQIQFIAGRNTKLINRLIKKAGHILKCLVKEPLLQFLLMGAVIFVLYGALTHWKEDRSRTIVIDEALETYLGNLYKAQFGGYPDTETLDQLVDNYIREEVMYREALKLGLAQQDEIIRRRLVQKNVPLIRLGHVIGP